jgi:hypothetical protein
VKEAVAQANDRAVAASGQLDLVDLRPLVVGADEVLGAVFHPLHRAAKVHGEKRDEDFLRVEHHHLRAKAAPGVWRDHADFVLGQAEERRKAAPDRDRRLGRVVDGELAGAGLVGCEHPAALERHPGAALDREGLGDPHLGVGEGGVGIAVGLHEAAGEVAGHVGVDERGALRRGGLEVDDHG